MIFFYMFDMKYLPLYIDHKDSYRQMLMQSVI
nr:MAG TPA: hypothetical protein [Caudoviricetes sp.]